MPDCLREVCWQPLGIALSVVFGLLSIVFAFTAYKMGNRIKNFEERENFHLVAYNRRRAKWSETIQPFQRAFRRLPISQPLNINVE